MPRSDGGRGLTSTISNVLKVNRKLASRQNWEQESRARAQMRYRTCTARSGRRCSTPAEAYAHRRRRDHTLRRAENVQLDDDDVIIDTHVRTTKKFKPTRQLRSS